jgi:hypothetical protein
MSEIPTQKTPVQKTPLQKAMPGLLIAGSLAGVGAIMVGLLSLVPSVDDGSGTLAAQDQPTTVQVENAGAFVLPRTFVTLFDKT